MKAAEDLRSFKAKVDEVYTKTLTASSTSNALDDQIAEGEAELCRINTDDAHADDNLTGVKRMERILEDSMRSNRNAREHLNLSVRERGLKVDALKERVQREADNRAAACSSLRDVVASDQNEVWSHFPKIASMGRSLAQKTELLQAIDVLENQLETVVALRQQLDAVRKRQAKVQDQVKEAQDKLQDQVKEAQKKLQEGQSKDQVAEEQPTHEKTSDEDMEAENGTEEEEVMEETTSPQNEVVTAHVALPEKVVDPTGYDSCYESGYDSCVESVRSNRVARTLIFRSPSKPRTPPPPPKPRTPISARKAQPIAAQITPPAGSLAKPSAFAITRTPSNSRASSLRNMLSVNLPSAKKGPNPLNQGSKAAASPEASPSGKRLSAASPAAKGLTEVPAHEAAAQQVAQQPTTVEQDGATEPKKPRRETVHVVGQSTSFAKARDSKFTPPPPPPTGGNVGKNTTAAAAGKEKLLQEGGVAADVTNSGREGAFSFFGSSSSSAGGPGGETAGDFNFDMMGGGTQDSSVSDTSSFFFANNANDRRPGDNSFFSTLF